jgi:hypothetical protein
VHAVGIGSAHPIHWNLREATTLHFVIPSACDFIDFPRKVIEFQTKLSSRPKRSEWRDLLFLFCPSNLTAPNKSHYSPLCHPERSRGTCSFPEPLSERLRQQLCLLVLNRVQKHGIGEAEDQDGGSRKIG